MLKKFILIAVIVVLIVVGYVQFFASTPPAPEPAPIAEVLPPDLKAQLRAQEISEQAPAAAPVPVETVKLAFSSNGSTRLRLKAGNPTDTEQMVSIPVGTPFESGRSLVVNLEPIEAEMVPGGTAELEVRAAALRPGNHEGDDSYTQMDSSLNQLEPLFQIVKEDSTLSYSVIQLAILTVMENPPLSAFANFPTVEDDLPVQEDFSAFSADAAELLNVLDLMQRADIDITRYQLGSNEQLKLETMVKPATRPLAQKVYGLSGAEEWEFWKNTTLNGDPRLRHYALYGIGRFYPSVAVQMMPNWANNPRLIPAYRLSAIYSLAMTASQDAYPVLEAMAERYPAESSLGSAVQESLQYLRAVAPPQ